ncbi:MAG: hypothetical protein IJE89_04700 [Bacilli bacterium]|nr:hypothetical protein [Bacilli bacterium]
MEKDNKKHYKGFILDIIIAVISGSLISMGLLEWCSSILSFNLPFSLQTIVGFVLGGGLSGLGTGLAIKKSLEKNKNKEYIEYDEYDLEEEELEDEYEEEKVSSLKIVKGSGNNYSYKYNNDSNTKLEIVNPDKKQTNKRR